MIRARILPVPDSDQWTCEVFYTETEERGEREWTREQILATATGLHPLGLLASALTDLRQQLDSVGKAFCLGEKS